MKKECLECGKTFDAKRSTAKFCSDACKVKHSRKEVKPEKEGGELFDVLSGIQEPVPRGYRGVDQESGYSGTDISEVKKVADIAPTEVKKPVAIRVKEVMKVKEIRREVKKTGYVPPSPMEAASRLRGLYNKKLGGID